MKPEYRLCPGGLVLTLSLGEVVSLGHHCFLQRKNPQSFSDLRSDSGDMCHGNKGAGEELGWAALCWVILLTRLYHLASNHLQPQLHPILPCVQCLTYLVNCQDSQVPDARNSEGDFFL